MSSVHLFSFFSSGPRVSIDGGAEEKLPWFMGSSITSKPEPVAGPTFQQAGTGMLLLPLWFHKQTWFKTTPYFCQEAFPGFRSSAALISISSFPQVKCHTFPHPFSPNTISLLTLGHSNPRISSKVPAWRALLGITKLQENTERANTWEQLKGGVRLLG